MLDVDGHLVGPPRDAVKGHKRHPPGTALFKVLDEARGDFVVVHDDMEQLVVGSDLGCEVDVKGTPRG